MDLGKLRTYCDDEGALRLWEKSVVAVIRPAGSRRRASSIGWAASPFALQAHAAARVVAPICVSIERKKALACLAHAGASLWRNQTNPGLGKTRTRKSRQGACRGGAINGTAAPAKPNLHHQKSCQLQGVGSNRALAHDPGTGRPEIATASKLS